MEGSTNTSTLPDSVALVNNMAGSSTSDMSYHDLDGDHDHDLDGDHDHDYEDDGGDNDAEDLDYYSDFDDQEIFEDEYSLLQSKLDNSDYPTGVEAPVFLLSKNKKKESVATSASTVDADSSSKKDGDPIVGIYQVKQFDVVDDFSDHYYAIHSGSSGTKPPKNWAKRIHQEWKILENDLPNTIFVRVCEARMEFLRAAIIGPAGTPYHDDLFVFDCRFPANYPDSPPSVYYHSGGLRINPNLYNSGKVCLSLLGTWKGRSTENWIPGTSTMLQVLVSIQALILNSRPYFNEPGCARKSGPKVEKISYEYNEQVFILSLKTMTFTLRNPPKHLEELIIRHFHQRAHDILKACKAYREGVLVGSNIKDGLKHDGGKKSDSRRFMSDLADMMNLLITSFSKNGTPGCVLFRPN